MANFAHIYILNITLFPKAKCQLPPVFSIFGLFSNCLNDNNAFIKREL